MSKSFATDTVDHRAIRVETMRKRGVEVNRFILLLILFVKASIYNVVLVHLMQADSFAFKWFLPSPKVM